MPYKIAAGGAATKERDDTLVNRFIDALLQPWMSTYDAFSRTEVQIGYLQYMYIGGWLASRFARENVKNKRPPVVGIG